MKMRFRPSFFPFTEPSMEVDIQCDRSRPARSASARASDWLEILGCGMVHPNVLRNCGLDPDEYQGFAWGMGIDRIAMLKYGMPDLRAFFDADVRWLQPLRLPPARPADAGRRAQRVSRNGIAGDRMKFTLSWLKDHLDTDASLERDRRDADHDRPRGRRRRGPGRAARALRHRLGDRGRAAPERRPAARLHGRYRRRASRCRSSAARPMRAPGMIGVFAAPGTYIPGNDMTLGVGTIRGVESRGMLCSERELRALRRPRRHHRPAGRRAGRRALMPTMPGSTIR